MNEEVDKVRKYLSDSYKLRVNVDVVLGYLRAGVNLKYLFLPSELDGFHGDERASEHQIMEELLWVLTDGDEGRMHGIFENIGPQAPFEANYREEARNRSGPLKGFTND